MQVYNFTEVEVKVGRGERIGQAIIMPVVKCELKETAIAQTAASRGGFGTTGS